LLPKFENPQIIAETIENKKNLAESTQNRSIRWISHPLRIFAFPYIPALCGPVVVAVW
jgi:hypothetical protein